MPANAKPVALPTAPAALIPPLAAALQGRGLAAPALLFLAGHRPLAFTAGQLLALAAPLAAMLGLRHTMDWAHLLATPEGIEGLEAALEGCRSGNLPDMAGRRDEARCRAAGPTYQGEHSKGEHSV